MEEKNDSYIDSDGFTESVDGLIETIRSLIIKPVKRFAGFLSLGFVLVALLIMAFVFFFMGSLKLIQGFGYALGLNPAGFAMASLGLVFLILSLRNYSRKGK